MLPLEIAKLTRLYFRFLTSWCPAPRGKLSRPQCFSVAFIRHKISTQGCLVLVEDISPQKAFSWLWKIRFQLVILVFLQYFSSVRMKIEIFLQEWGELLSQMIYRIFRTTFLVMNERSYLVIFKAKEVEIVKKVKRNDCSLTLRLCRCFLFAPWNFLRNKFKRKVLVGCTSTTLSHRQSENFSKCKMYQKYSCKDKFQR